MALDPRIEVIRETYGLDREDFWELPQKRGTWLAKHSALELVAAKANIVFDMPQILEARGGDGIAAVCVLGRMDDKSEWSIGEASPKNSKNAYPWAMAEKRAKDRVILKLIGVHGLVYSEDEIDDAPPAPAAAAEPKPSKAKTRDVYAELRDEIDGCMTLDDLGRLWRSSPFQAEFKKLTSDWQQMLTEHKDQRKADLEPRSNGLRNVTPDFEGLSQ